MPPERETGFDSELESVRGTAEVPARPDAGAVEIEAGAGMDDGERRVQGAEVSWSDDWQESLDDAVMERVGSFLR